MKNLELLAIENIPLIEPGDDLVSILIQTIKEEKIKLRRGDILVIAQKVVSKSENRYAYLNDVVPSSEAIRIAKNSDKDPKLVQLILKIKSLLIGFYNIINFDII